MNSSSTFDAKNNLSALIAAALKGKPQLITNNGEKTAVLISYEEYLKLTARNESLVDFLMNSPLRESELDLTRSKSVDTRQTIEFD